MKSYSERKHLFQQLYSLNVWDEYLSTIPLHFLSTFIIPLFPFLTSPSLLFSFSLLSFLWNPLPQLHFTSFNVFDTCISLQHFLSLLSLLFSPASVLLSICCSNSLFSSSFFCPSPLLPPHHLHPPRPLSAHHLPFRHALISDPTLPPSFCPSSLLLPRPHLFHPAASEIDWSSSFGTVSTISLLSCPPLPLPLDPSAPPPASAARSRLNTDLEGTTHPARPSPYAYQVPAFVRAHPPALPKIFQPAAGSGTGRLTDLQTD